MSGTTTKNIKQGRIQQRVPDFVEEQFNALVADSKLPAAICLQMLITKAYEQLENSKDGRYKSGYSPTS